MNTGGFAFPLTASTGDPRDGVYCQNGMTLLDWMAGQALAGFFGYISETQAYLKDAGHAGIKRDQVAKECYEQAQAMLDEKARREADHSENKLGKADHFPDATKMAALEAANREFVEALELLMSDDAAEGCDEYRKEKARAILAKHKATT